ncbi:chorismate lyase [Candidatus Berkiella cookevillensis]|uniref:Chorismate lyase n=1 Tax=Candidatus Berkiella cookevillensis TaxID=437022 RepID=A0A0Q9YC79_9GAMM|nr:chorismate lyase [Candidatus Berkiella cookevillensis]MCS5708673.1 chorismate lyase [Candidatus Berkiella cookevillensis]
MIWHKDALRLAPLPPQRLMDWLTGPQILSAELSKVYTKLSLERLSEGAEVILATEQAALLKLTPVQERYYVRSVFLIGNDTPVIFARTVIPEKTYQQYAENFASLGNQFIGLRLLHNKENVVRSAFEYAAVKAQNPLYQEAVRFGAENQAPILWARRSVFWMGGLPLLITELFLSALY